jgi:pyruvate/2-oxoacid:ferredoxin oxidoreductase alpha subunit
MIKVITGNEAAAYGALLAKPEVVCAYPITPQSRIPEQLAEFQAQGLFKGKFINVESEVAAMGYVIGASAGGVRVFTATSSQGLAVMHEQLHWAAGARLPIVMVNVNRPLAAPWNLTSEQTDSLSQRDTGWMQLYCESNQETLDTVLQAYKTAESISLPIMVCMDGVYLSYIAETVDIRDQDRVDAYLPVYRPTLTSQRYGYKIFMKESPQTMSYGRPSFMADRYELFKLESQAVDRFMQANEEFKSIFGDGYLPVEGYKSDDADVVLVTMGSAVGTCRCVIDEMQKEGLKVGLIKLKMFRPFPKKLIREALSGRKKIAIIDRNISHGQCGFAHQEIKWALNMAGVMPPPTYGFIAGLGGEDITPELVKKAIQFTLNNDPVDQDVIWLGLAEKRQYDDYDKNTIQVR